MRTSTRLALNAERRRLEKLWRQHQADLETWRRTLRPCFLRLFTQRSAALRWSRTLLTLLLDELHTEDGFFELVGDLRHLPVRQFPQAIAIAIALRHSWRPDDLAHLARRLGITLSVTALARGPHGRRSNRPHTSAVRTSNSRGHRNAGHHVPDCGARRRAVKALRFAPTPVGANGLDSGGGRAQRPLLRDGRGNPPRASRSSRS
jgi:hypothetical protein